MALYIITSLMLRKEGEVKYLKPVTQAIVTNAPDSEVEACEAFRTAFSQGKNAAEGWELHGEPYLIEFFREHFEEWKHSLSPAPQKREEKPKPAHLKVVK